MCSCLPLCLCCEIIDLDRTFNLDLTLRSNFSVLEHGYINSQSIFAVKQQINFLKLCFLRLNRFCEKVRSKIK